jgi:type IV secretory pathway VirB10-like protein
MTSNARIFFAGVGTTFVILTIGFGGGLMLAKSALHDHPPQMRASSEPTPGMRVILPPSADPAIPVAERTAAPEPKPQVLPVREVQSPVEQRVEKEDPKKAERDLKAERRRYAERKAKRIAAARARQQVEPRERTEPGIMAFGSDESRMRFGN